MGNPADTDTVFAVPFEATAYTAAATVDPDEDPPERLTCDGPDTPAVVVLEDPTAGRVSFGVAQFPLGYSVVLTAPVAGVPNVSPSSWTVATS